MVILLTSYLTNDKFAFFMRNITISSLVSILFVLIISCNERTPICIDMCHGKVIAIENSSIEKIDTFTIAELTTDKIIKFRTIGHVGISVSHLKEHMLIVEPVSVSFYVNTDGQNIATNVADLTLIDRSF
tara:strand:+ start:1630 stop:2019 length:390 start_codon:yes stop_codon:yes gene_type:complete